MAKIPQHTTDEEKKEFLKANVAERALTEHSAFQHLFSNYTLADPSVILSLLVEGGFSTCSHRTTDGVDIIEKNLTGRKTPLFHSIQNIFSVE